jgi:nucleolar protein 9
MPRENKNRGRREEKKLKRKNEATENLPSKRQKSQAMPQEVQVGIAPESANAVDGEIEDAESEERPFYGMLEDEEQEYFRRADEKLELNDFSSSEDCGLFLESIYREAEGKELKIACSQSCSRLLERLILLSTVEQKKKLFGNFSGNFTHLVQHRFASHCCEMLFIQSAGVVTEELLGNIEVEEGEEALGSMESLFLSVLDELEGDMTALLTSRFASHTLRVLLVILSGRPLEKSSTQTMLKSKRKEKVTITNLASQQSLGKRAVPEMFSFAVNKIISDTIATMDESFIVVLAQHPTGNPTLQLLLELELTSKSKAPKPEPGQKTLLSTLLPDDISAEDSKSQAFINGLMYDAVGSRLLEKICTFAPSKTFKQIYRIVFKDRIAGLARNEIASYVVICVLKRLSPEDLEEAITAILPQVTDLVQRSRTVILKTLVERCHERGIDIAPLTAAISAAFGSDPATLLLKMANIADLSSLTAAVLPPPQQEGTDSVPQIPRPSPPQLHGSLLAQALLAIPGAPTALIQAAILTLPPATLHTLALYTPTSHILQSALGSSTLMSTSGEFKSLGSTVIEGDRQPYLPTPANLTFRRKIIGQLLTPSDHCPEPVITLAESNIGTHILDSLLLSAPSLLSLIERMANTLSSHEHILRDSFTGRIVWRNWNMDLFKRRRAEWIKKVKEIPLPPAGIVTLSVPASLEKADAKAKDKNKKAKKDFKAYEGQLTKTPIELAREKHFTKVALKEKMKDHKGTGANAFIA